MEEVNGALDAVDLDDALRKITEMLGPVVVPETTFVAVYDPHSGEVSAVGPTEAFVNEHYTIEVDKEVAIDVIEGRLKITSCYVDIDEEKLEVVEVKNVVKIDDLMHRIPLKKFAEFDKPDIYVIYSKKSKSLKIQLSEEHFGTKKLPKKYQPAKQKKTRWAGDTGLTFLITRYNDPHAIIEEVSLTIDDLIGNTKIYKNIEVPEKFSVFTRRVFKNYVLEVK